MKKIIFILSLLILISSPALASAKDGNRQFTSRGILTDGTPVFITVVASGSDEKRANQATNSALSRIRWLDHQLFGPQGLETGINSLPKDQPLKLPPDAFVLIEKAIQLSAQSDSWFDVAAPSPKHVFVRRDWRRIVLDKKGQTISFKSDDMKLDLKKISKGFYVDMAMAELSSAGFENAMAQVGPVHRNRGHDIFTPWNVQIGFGNAPDSQFAHRVYNYNMSNIAAATVTPNGLARGLIDGRNKKPVPGNAMRSITVFARDASTATAFALVVYAVGQKRGIQYVDRHTGIEGIMVNNSGQIETSADFNISNLKAAKRWPQSGRGDDGPNDLRQKRREEAGEM